MNQNKFDDPKLRTNLPADLYDHIKGISIDISATFLFLLIIVFLPVDPSIRSLLFLISIYIVNILPYHFVKGHTIGKIISETKLTHTDGSDVRLYQVYLREIFKWSMGIFTIGIYYVVAALLLESRADKRSLHDLLFKTKIVSTKKFYR